MMEVFSAGDKFLLVPLDKSMKSIFLNQEMILEQNFESIVFGQILPLNVWHKLGVCILHEDGAANGMFGKHLCVQCGGIMIGHLFFCGVVKSVPVN